MSLCSRCGHNSVMHPGPEDGGCFETALVPVGEVLSTNIGPVLTSNMRPFRCGCPLERWDPEFREGQDAHGNLRDGWPR